MRILQNTFTYKRKYFYRCKSCWTANRNFLISNAIKIASVQIMGLNNNYISVTISPKMPFINTSLYLLVNNFSTKYYVSENLTKSKMKICTFLHYLSKIFLKCHHHHHHHHHHQNHHQHHHHHKNFIRYFIDQHHLITSVPYLHRK